MKAFLWLTVLLAGGEPVAGGNQRTIEAKAK